MSDMPTDDQLRLQPELHGKYLFIKSNKAAPPLLYYINNEGKSEKVNIENFDKFEKSINPLLGNKTRVQLTISEFTDIITSNGGHTVVPCPHR